MRVIGLTGGIGCGKSTVAALFAAAGVPVVDADRIAREAVAPGTEGHAGIVARFGTGILSGDGAIDRDRLGRIVFSDPAARADLEGITLPRIRAGIDARLAELEREGFKAAVVEAALIHENRRASQFESVVCVYCDRPTQLRRLLARGGLSESEAVQRMDSQMDLTEKARLSDHVIDNSGSREETIRQVDSLIAGLGLAGRPDDGPVG
jgi:dephospho-CoA kinase